MAFDTNPPGSSVPPGPGGPPPVGPGGRPPRPTAVTAAAGLMVLVAVLALISAIASFAAKDAMVAMLRESAEAQDAVDGAPTPETLVNIALGAGVCVYGALAIMLVVLALLNLRGKNVARIITWVVCGIFSCCMIGSVASNINGDMGRLSGLLRGLTIGVSVVSLLSLIAVIVLLALPRSNDYFNPKATGQMY